MEVHHVSKLADLDKPGPKPDWATLMAKRRRKTLVACMPCHQDIHTGKPFSIITGQSLESDVQ
jgi:hypothetical protein